MEIINGHKIVPIFNFYNILIDNAIDGNFIKDLSKLVKKVKANKQGIWLKIKEETYKKINLELLQLIQKEFNFYYNDINDNYIIFSCTKLTNYPPAPNTNIGTHLMIMTPDNKVLTTIEDDGKGGEKISLPGGHIDLNDNGVQNALIREFGEEITKSIKINKNKLKLVTVRQISEFPRLGNMFKNQDIWFLFKLELSNNDCNKIIKKYKKNQEVKEIELMEINTIAKKVSWLSKDLINAINNDSNINIHNSDNAYNGIPGLFFY